MIDQIVVFFILGIKYIFFGAFLLGWIPALFAVLKGKGTLLWIAYVVCISIVALTAILDEPVFSLSTHTRDALFSSDSSIYAKIKGGYGMSVPAADAITSISNAQAIGFFYSILLIWFFTFRLKHNHLQARKAGISKTTKGALFNERIKGVENKMGQKSHTNEDKDEHIEYSAGGH